MAAAYAGYLDPNLEVEIREVWLRYRAGDATLADEILQRASAEANHWAGMRALPKVDQTVGSADTAPNPNGLKPNARPSLRGISGVPSWSWSWAMHQRCGGAFLRTRRRWLSMRPPRLPVRDQRAGSAGEGSAGRAPPGSLPARAFARRRASSSTLTTGSGTAQSARAGRSR